MDDQKQSFPLIPLVLGLVAVMLLAGAARKQWMRAGAAAQSFRGAEATRLMANAERDGKKNELEQRTIKLERVDKFLSSWADTYRKGSTFLNKGGQFTAYTNRLTDGTGVTRQKAEPGSAIDQTYIAIGETSVPARPYTLEFTGSYESLLRVVGSLEQDIDLLACSRIEFRVTDKHLTCAYLFAYPSLSFPQESVAAISQP